MYSADRLFEACFFCFFFILQLLQLALEAQLSQLMLISLLNKPEQLERFLCSLHVIGGWHHFFLSHFQTTIHKDGIQFMCSAFGNMDHVHVIKI